MPARIHRPINTEATRRKIRAAHLIRRLQMHIDGKLDTPLTMSQVRAIDILLRKIVPDLHQTTISGELTKYVVEVPPLLTKDEWQKKYRPTTIDHEPTKTIESSPMLPLITKQ